MAAIKIAFALTVASILWSAAALAQTPAPHATGLIDVTAELRYLRQSDGVLRLGVVLHNSGAKEALSHEAIDFGQIVIVDPKANKKHYALKDAGGHFLAGPISDWNGSGRWFPKIDPGADTLVWVLFDAVPSGSVVTVEGPLIGTFDQVAVGDAPPPSAAPVSSVPPLQASLVSAIRAEGRLKVQLKLVNPGPKAVASHTVAYADVYALDPVGKRAYPLLKGADGLFLATPMADKNEGGRWFLSKVQPGGQVFVDLTFQAPPDDVKSVDVAFPWFGPFEAAAIAGLGGATPSGIAVAGTSTDLERAIKDLNAQVTQQAITVDLSADLLFDFDKSDLKPAAEPELNKVVAILGAYPKARVSIAGHTDGKGSDAYNQTLSERRAATVAQWLLAHASIPAANIETHGWGRSKPVAPNENPDGSDNPDGRAKNRRVEIVVTKS